MPPTTSLRTKPSGDTSSSAKRTSSGRAVTRPNNYYARPFAATRDASEDAAPQGFFPGLQYFSDAITALPKEVMRQVTLMKEVEAKVHGPNEQMADLLDTLLELPVPTRAAGRRAPAPLQGLVSLTASNSAIGSAYSSIVNGAGRASVEPSVNGDEQQQLPQPETEEELARRMQYYELRLLTHNLLPNLDEKSVVLAEANRVLTAQLSRIDLVLPHVHNELSDEARLGSLTHWAYSENRMPQKAKVPAAQQRRERDVMAANSLAAAASAVHEMDVTAARREARAEKQKAGKGRELAVDSEFEERPKKTHAKVAKARAAGLAMTGLGISTNGEPVKRKKVEKGLAAPPMERTLSAAARNKAAAAARETPRSTPTAGESAVRKTTVKAKPTATGPKRKMPNSAHASPALASSPLHSSFNASNLMEPPAATSTRPQNARLRQNSTATAATNLRYERTAEDGLGSRPSTTAGVEKTTNGKRKAPPADDDGDAIAENDRPKKTTERDQNVKNELDTEMPDIAELSHSNSSKVGKGSKAGTPRDEHFPDDVDGARARASRSMRNNAGHDSSSPESQQDKRKESTGPKRKHVRNPSSHLVKQLAPFNRSPDVDRHVQVSEEEEGNEDGELRERDEGAADEIQARRSRSRRNTVARKLNSGGINSPAISNPPTREDEDERMLDAEPIPTLFRNGGGDSNGSLHAGADEAVPSLEADDGISISAASPLSHIADNNTSTINIEQEDEEDEDPASPLPPSDGSSDNDENLAPSTHSPSPSHQALPPTDLASDLEELDSDHDPDDPSEPKYCYCNRGSYGEMVACDNEACVREWFHLGCTELREAPGEEEVWFCGDCRPEGWGRARFRGGGGGRGAGVGSGRGRGRGRGGGRARG